MYFLDCRGPRPLLAFMSLIFLSSSSNSRTSFSSRFISSGQHWGVQLCRQDEDFLLDVAALNSLCVAHARGLRMRDSFGLLSLSRIEIPILPMKAHLRRSV